MLNFRVRCYVPVVVTRKIFNKLRAGDENWPLEVANLELRVWNLELGIESLGLRFESWELIMGSGAWRSGNGQLGIIHFQASQRPAPNSQPSTPIFPIFQIPTPSSQLHIAISPCPTPRYQFPTPQVSVPNIQVSIPNSKLWVLNSQPPSFNSQLQLAIL